MNRRIIFVVILLSMISTACALTGKTSTQPEEDVVEEEAAIVIPTVKPTMTPDSAQAAPQAQQAQPTAQQNQEGLIQEPQNTAETVTQNGSSAARFFVEEFEGEINEVDWYIEAYSGSDDDDPYYLLDQRRGSLEFYIDSPYLYLYRLYAPHLYQDIRIDFEVENKGVNTNNIGAICRYTDYGWYEFITTSGGYYSIMRYDVYGDEELGYGGIQSISFGADKKNIYSFICDGKHLILIVNGVEIADVTDEEFLVEGVAGINVSAEEVLPVRVQFNWLEFSAP